MIVVNQSNWHTADLEHLLECVRGMPGHLQGRHVNSDTVILFTTSRKKKGKTNAGATVQPPAASAKIRSDRWDNTIVVAIRSSAQLQMDVLDRIANINDDYVQDMSPADVVVVAECITSALHQRGFRQQACSWAQYKSLRARTDKISPSPLLKQREIDALTRKQREIHDSAICQIAILEAKIRELRAQG